MSFYLSGGVEVLGFISPTEITDEYPVIDPLYGIDGLRNVNLLSDLNTIPTPRRRPGMIVGVSGGTQYYKLNSPPWNNTISDWSIFNSDGGSFTGGTVTGNTIFTNGLTANTLTVNGILITGDTYATGGTYSNGTLDFYNNTGGSYQVTGLYTGQTSYVNSLTTGVGLSGDSTTGNVTIINTDPDQIVSISGGTGILTGGTYPNFTIENTLPDQVVSISGGTGILTGGTYPNFTIENSLPDQTVVLNNGTNISVTGTYPNFTIDVTGLTDNNTYTTGFTYQDNTFTISDSSGNTFNATINSVTGLTVNGILSASTISGGTLYGDGSNLTGLSTGLNVGTTQITNGTSGRVLFQSGTTLQQDGNFTFDSTLKRLTLKAVGVGTSDTPFIIQNSTGTVNLLEQNGVGSLLTRSNDTFSYLGLFYRSDGANGWTLTNSHSGFGLGTGIETVGNNLYFLTTGTRALSVSTQGTGTFKTYGIWNYGSGSGQRLLIGENVFDPQLTLSGLGNLGLGTYTAGARLDVRAQGALSTDIAFRVRNSADTADLISFRGDGSEWIQSVPFRHAAFATGTNNANQGILLGYNVASLSTTSLNCVVIGRGSGAILQGNGNTIIGDGFTQGTFTNSIGLGRGVFVSNSNHFFCGSDSFPVNTWWVSTGGEASSGTNLRGLDFRVSGMVGGPGNISAAAHPIRFFSPNGTGNGAGSNIQFHVAPSNTGGASFNRNIFSEMFTIRGEADGLNHYQLSTPRVPSASITDGYIQYSADRGGTAGRASAHFRSEDGTINVLGDRTGINTSTPQARLHVANADTTLTTGLFSGTGQNILTVIGSGNTTSSPIFTVQGSSGELFSVSDSLVGSLFSVNDISGLPILEVFSDNTTLMGSYLAPSLNTTSRVIATTGTTNVYSIPTSAYTGAFFDYTVSDGTNLRAGNIMSIWSGTSVNITETQTTDFGNTSGLTFNMVVSSGNAILRTSGVTGNWTVKTIVRSI